MIPIDAWSRLTAIINPATHLESHFRHILPGADRTPICYAKMLALDPLTSMILHRCGTNLVAGIFALLLYLSAAAQEMCR